MRHTIPAICFATRQDDHTALNGNDRSRKRSNLIMREIKNSVFKQFSHTFGNLGMRKGTVLITVPLVRLTVKSRLNSGF